ncbi:MAG: hypothetical protein R2839_03190, partial [Thermomicrobiales bacterium]
VTADALQQSWDKYFKEINDVLAERVSELPGVSFDPANLLPCEGPRFGFGVDRCARYLAFLSGGEGETWVALSVLESSSAANEAMETMHGGLIRSGWQPVDVEGLEHNHVCLTLVRGETSEAVCYITRDDALIVSYSYLDVAAPDAVLLNAVDLARLMDDAYDAVERPV